MIEIQAYQCSNIISYLLKLAWQLPSDTRIDHVIATACVRTITLLYIYFYIWGLDLRLNNINFHQSLSFIIYINLNHHCYYYWTSKSLLNLWEYTQDSDITNKWVVHFVIGWMLIHQTMQQKKFCWYSVRIDDGDWWLTCQNLWIR